MCYVEYDVCPLVVNTTKCKHHMVRLDNNVCAYASTLLSNLSMWRSLLSYRKAFVRSHRDLGFLGNTVENVDVSVHMQLISQFFPHIQRGKRN